MGGEHAAGGGRLRPFRPDDIPAVVALRRRVFRFSERASAGALADYCERVFCGHPWPDGELSSFVYEDGRGRPVGFLGVIPRPMRFQGERIRAAVATQLMVAPESRGLAGRALARAFITGPQDLSLSDTANDAARRLWESVGGCVGEVLSFTWEHVLRPCRRLALGLRHSGGRRRALLALIGPALAAGDAVAARLSGAARPAEGGVEPVAAASLARCAADVLGGYALRPEYDEPGLAWLLERAREKRQFGALEGWLVRSTHGQPAGWFLCYVEPRGGGVAQVLQIAARPGAQDLVVAHLLEHVRRRGAAVVQGRLEPGLLRALAARGCRLGPAAPPPWLLFHSPRSEIRQAIERGDAALSRLDGEWWLSF